MSRRGSGTIPLSTGSLASRGMRVSTLRCQSEHGFAAWGPSQWSKWGQTHFLPMATTSRPGRRKVKTSCGHTYSLTIYPGPDHSGWPVRRWVGQVLVDVRLGLIYTLDIAPDGGFVVDHSTGGTTHFHISDRWSRKLRGLPH